MSTDMATRLSKASEPIPSSFFETLITASHILSLPSLPVVDGFGHVSARSPRDPANTFFMSRNCAPALVSKREDIVEYRISDATPLDEGAPRGFLERYIHSEIYKRYPDVHAVVHAHAEEMVTFSIVDVPCQPVYHMGGVMGPGASVPVWDIASSYKSSDTQDMLISNSKLGHALAEAFAPSTLLGKTGDVLKSLMPGSSEQTQSSFPPHPVVLMRGHGFTAVGRGSTEEGAEGVILSIKEVVYRSIFSVKNARIQLAAISLQGAYNNAAVAKRTTKIGKEGYEGGSGDDLKLGEVKYLSEKEAKDAWKSNSTQVHRPWQLWSEEARTSGLYKNEYWK